MDRVAKIFGGVGVIAIVAMIPLIIYAFRKRKNYAIFLAVTSIYACVTALSYTLSLFNDVSTHYFYAMFTSTIYFTSIDCMLLFLVMATMAFTNSWGVKRKTVLFTIIAALGIADLGMLWTNCFLPVEKQFAISLTSVPTHPTIPVFISHWPWHFHLTFTFFMVIVVISLFHNKSKNVPKGYKRQYTIPSIAIFSIVFINLIFLLFQTNEESTLKMIDISVLLYPFGIIGVYFGFFYYKEVLLPSRFKNFIVDNGFNGIVGFDWENKLITMNSNAENCFPELKDKKGKEIEYMSEVTGISTNEEQSRICQCYTTNVNGLSISLRCDYIVRRNKYGKIITKVFYFQDISPETDPLTGFMKEEAFNHTNLNREHVAIPPKSVCIFDISGLGTINATKGRDEGDKTLKRLSEMLVSRYPKTTNFIRGKEGNIYVICVALTQLGAKNVAATIKHDFEGAEIDYAVLPFGEGDVLQDTMKKVETALNTIKLLNSKSSKSNVVASLLKALEETDLDTEGHVERTTVNAEKLGKRLGLSDYDLSRLKLLTVLHDIGKIAIPLDILNKPGRLSDHEFEIMKSHTTKGYEIAKSNKALQNIAKEIKQHHERWDGKGYPDGLEKESISYLARIVSIVDSFDAMTNDRVYRKALSWDEAKEELRRCAGTQFDPHVTAEFLRMLDEEIHIDLKPVKKENELSNIALKKGLVANMVFPMSFGKYILDEKDRIVEVDKNFTAITGYTLEDCLDKKMKQKDLIPEEDMVEYLTTVEKQFAQGSDTVLIEHRIIKKDGNTTYVYCIGRRHFETFSKKIMSEILIVDCSLTHAARLGAEMEKDRAKTQRESWERKYRRDGLTGLLTHNAFENDVESAILAGEKNILFMIFDLDGFKGYNDTKGHKAGDEYLVLVANHLAQSMRKGDLCCRLGGDEFAAALPIDKGESIESVKQRAESLLLHLNGTLTFVDNSYCKFSCGASFTVTGFDSFNKLYIDADKALYESKDREKGTLTFGSSLK